MLSEDEFYQKLRRYFKRYHKHCAHYPDDDEGDQMLLIVTDDIPSQTINSILAGNREYKVPRSVVWLADDNYEHLPDFQGATVVRGTEPTVQATWKSQFLGKSLADMVTWDRNIPEPPKAVYKSYFAVLQKGLYEKRGMVLICTLTVSLKQKHSHGLLLVYRNG